MKITIQQIADMAHVSKGTVSKVLNGHKVISTETRDRILQLVETLDYTPDATARALALQKTGTLGLLIPHDAESSLGGFFWSVALSAISKEAVNQGYNLMVLTTKNDGEIKSVINPILRNGNVDGLIIGSELLDEESLSKLIHKNIPFVLLGQNPVFRGYCVDVDSTEGSKQMVSHLIQEGYKKIGILLGPEEYPYTQERYLGYRQTLQEFDLSWHASIHASYDNKKVIPILNTFMDEHPDMDALFISSGGEFFLDSLKVIRERKNLMPDFGFGVFDDYPFLEYLNPQITAVRQPIPEVGKECVTMLLELIKGSTPQKKALKLLPTLMVRQSSIKRKI